MAINIFRYTDYKSYICDRIKTGGKITKGLRSKISQHIGCQSSYLSQVLNGKPNLTLEQAIRLNGFFVHGAMESKYFMLLVELSRAGSKELQDFYLTQIREAQDNHVKLTNRIKKVEAIPLEAQHKYYSAWFYSAIHVAISVPEFQDPQNLARQFHLPLNIVVDVITFLESIGLVEKKSGAFHLTKKSFYLNRESDFIQRHHINWRSQALQSVEKNIATDLHYSNVIAISKSDFPRIKEVFINSIEKARDIIRPSAEEDVYTIVLDCFKL